MSDRDGSSFATAPVAPGGGRRPLVVAILVVGLVVGSFTLARLMPEPEAAEVARSVAPTRLTAPKPTVTPAVAEAAPTATAMPPREWFTAPEAPIDDVLVTYIDGTRWLRLGNAIHTDEPVASGSDDLLLLGEQDVTVCLCWELPDGFAGPTRLVLIRRDDELHELARTTVFEIEGSPVAGDMPAAYQVALDASPDGRTGYLLLSERRIDQWRVRLVSFDLLDGRQVADVDLLVLPQDDPSVILSAEAPTLRVASDGRHVLGMAEIQRLTSFGTVTSTRHAWVVGLDGGSFGTVVPTDAIADAAVDRAVEGCAWIDFVRPDVIAKGCRYKTGADADSAVFEIRRYDSAGNVLGNVPTDDVGDDLGRVLLDTTNGVAYAWAPDGHRLLALDLVDGGLRSARLPQDDLTPPAGVSLLGARPARGDPVAWSDGRSATQWSGSRSMVGSADGRLLYAAGDGPATDSTSGIWVFDTETLDVVERWPALAAYESLTLFENGRFLAALGRPGVTATGGPAEWGPSVTVHDASTGWPVVRVGDPELVDVVGFPTLGPPAATP
jgi:hypothetical protein